MKIFGYKCKNYNYKSLPTNKLQKNEMGFISKF